MTKIPGTEKGRNHKKLGIGNNEHVGEGSGTQKCLKFVLWEVRKQIKAEHPKKFKFLCLRTYTHGVFEIKIAVLVCSSTFSAFIKKINMPKNILNH